VAVSISRGGSTPATPAFYLVLVFATLLELTLVLAPTVLIFLLPALARIAAPQIIIRPLDAAPPPVVAALVLPRVGAEAEKDAPVRAAKANAAFMTDSS